MGKSEPMTVEDASPSLMGHGGEGEFRALPAGEESLTGQSAKRWDCCSLSTGHLLGREMG